MRLQAEHRFVGLKSSIFCLETGFTPNTFLSGDGTGMVCEWNLQEREKAKALLQLPSQIFALRYLPQEQLLAVGTMSGQLFFYDHKKPGLHSLAHQLNGAIFSIEKWGDLLLVATESGEIVALDANLQIEKKWALSKKSIRKIVIFSPEEFFYAGSNHLIEHFLKERISAQREAIVAHQNSVFALIYLKERKELWSGARDAHIGVHQIAEEETETEILAAHMYTINALLATEDEQYVVSGSRDKSIKLWRTEDRKLLQVIQQEKGVGHQHSVNALLRLDNNAGILSGSDDRSIFWWSFNDKL